MIPRDKLLHTAAGFAVALIACELWVLLVAFRALPIAALSSLPMLAATVALIAGLLKEFCDWQDNRAMAAEGREPIHGVELWDVLATFIGGLLFAAALLALHRVGVIAL